MTLAWRALAEGRDRAAVRQGGGAGQWLKVPVENLTAPVAGIAAEEARRSSAPKSVIRSVSCSRHSSAAGPAAAYHCARDHRGFRSQRASNQAGGFWRIRI